MKTIDLDFQAHLDSGATSLCWCWRVVRTDGVVLGFTDHDRDLAFDDMVFEAASGLSASDIESSIGLGVDNLDVESVLNSDTLSEEDLAAGLFDNAKIEIYRVNWSAPDQRVLMRSGNIGEITRGGHAFRAEVRGLAHALQQPQGRIYQYGCDADLGDQRCGVLLENPLFKGAGIVLAVEDQRVLRVAGLDDFEGDWFSAGLLNWTVGLNGARGMEVKLHSVSDAVVTIELWQKMASEIQVGDQFEIFAGCDKQFSTCKAKFSNGANFRGFPHMPGNDFALSYPNSDDADLDGGSLNS